MWLHNCESISEGREQQKKEQEQKARLRREQGEGVEEKVHNRMFDEHDEMFRPPPDLHHTAEFVQSMALPQADHSDSYVSKALISIYQTTV